MRGAGPRRASAQQGFSLVELMTVVSIVGILAMVAIPTFQGYVNKSRTSEATQFLGIIKLREEAYRSEFGRYAQINAVTALGSIEYAPGNLSVMHDGVAVPFPGGSNPADWNQLGAKPGGPVRFGYGIAAGLPDTAPTAASTQNTCVVPSGGRGYAKDHWWFAAGISDLDGDGNPTVYEAYSQKTGIWYCPFKGWE